MSTDLVFLPINLMATGVYLLQSGFPAQHLQSLFDQLLMRLFALLFHISRQRYEKSRSHGDRLIVVDPLLILFND